MNEIENKISYIEIESKKIINAVLFHVKDILELENSYKLKHKKTIGRLKEVIFKLERIEDSIKFQTDLLLKMRDEGMLKCQKDEGGEHG